MLALYFIHVQAFSLITFSGIIQKGEELSWVPHSFFSSFTLRTYISLMSERGQAGVAADSLLCFSQVIGELGDACVM